MNAEDILKGLNDDAQERNKRNKSKIEEFYKDMPPYTKEELLKKPEKWWANELLIIHNETMRKIKEASNE